MPRTKRIPRHRPSHWTAACILALAGASCAAASGAPDERPPPDTAGTAQAEPERPVDRPYVYEVAPEQERRPAPSDTAATIEVSGSAEVELPTDRARVTFAVETEEATAREASEENARWMESVLSALREAGPDGLEIETFGYSLAPRYRRPDSGTHEIDGYRARNLIRVTTGDLEGVGSLLDTAIGAGANRVTSLTFEASNTGEARQRALREAVRTARREAATIAEAMGVALGEPVHVQVAGGGPEPVTVEQRAFRSAERPTPVEPGSQTVEASVTIRYRIGPPEQR